MPNPGFEPETRRWRPGAVAPIGEGSLACERRGPTERPPGPPGRKKRFLSNLFLDDLRCSREERPLAAGGDAF